MRRQLLGAMQIVIGKVTELVERADRQQCRQPGRRLDRLRVELQRRFEITDRFVVPLGRDGFRQLGAAAHDVIDGIR